MSKVNKKVNNNKNNDVPLSKRKLGKRIAIALAGVTITGALAGGIAYFVNPQGFKDFLNISSGTELVQDEKDNEEVTELKNKVKILEESINLLKTEKETAIEKLNEYKASLDSEKELTAEQQSKIDDLEKSVEEKDALILNLENQVEILTKQIEDLQNQLAGATNSVKEKLSTFEMKFDSANITNLYKFENFLFLSSNNSVEVVNLTTSVQKSIIAGINGSSEFYEINNNLYISNSSMFGYFNKETEEFVNFNVESINYDRLMGELEEVKVLEDGSVYIKTTGTIAFLSAENEFKIYRIKAFLNENDVIYFKGFADGSTNYGLYKIENYNQVTKLLSISNADYSYGGGTITKINDYLIYYCRTNASSSFNLKKFNLTTQEESNLINAVSSQSEEPKFVNFDNKYFMIINGISSTGTGIYKIVNGTATKMSTITNYQYYDLKVVNGYLFDSTFSYVYNITTGEFQLALTSASTTNKDKFVINNGTLILTNQAKYFDEESLTFKDFYFESNDYTGCNYNVQEVNGKLFCSSNLSSLTKQGVFYIDLETKTIKKVTDSGNGDILNTGYYFSNSISLSEDLALIFDCNSSEKYAVVIDTNTMQVTNVYTNFGANIVIYKNKAISNYNNYIKVLDLETMELKTIYSKESTSSLTISYTQGNNVYFSTNNAGDTVVLNLEDYSVAYEYGVGNIDLNGLKLGLHSTSSTIYDPETGDLMNIKGLSKTPTIFEFEDATMFINDTIVYSISKGVV